MIRALAAVSLLATAPIQCSHKPDPSLDWNDSPGDALWNLAERFRAAHDEAGARRTLAFLVERYPSSRWAAAARDELDGGVPMPDGGEAR